MTRTHPADHVYVTGTFDNWGKTVKLEKNGIDGFEKLVDLPSADDKVYYKVSPSHTSHSSVARPLDAASNASTPRASAVS